MRIPDPEALKRRAQALRREELARLACSAAVKWRALLKTPAHAPFPCKDPAPTHS